MAIAQVNDYTFSLDVKQRVFIPPMSFYQASKDTGILNITLTKNLVPINLTGNMILMTAKRNDESLFIDINADRIQVINAIGGVIKIILPTSILSVPGIVGIQISVIGTNSEELPFPEFSITVKDSYNKDEAIPASNDYAALINGLSQVQSIKNDEEIRIVSENTRISSENTRISNEATRQTNESTRQTQEASRVSAESSRVTAESGRVSAENTRVSNENTRQTNEGTRQTNEAVRQQRMQELEQIDAVQLDGRMDTAETTITEGGLDKVKTSSKFITTMLSWLGIVNTKYLTDNGTRFYILPRAKVTTGTGGCIKIFADNYQDGADYRDFGLYFSANQNNDTGYHGNGVNWLNVKVMDGGQYADKHPDLGFCFQDGQFVAGRWVLLKHATLGQYPVFVVGDGAVPTFQGAGSKVAEEMHGNLGFRNGDRILWLKADGSGTFGIFGDSNNNLIRSLATGEKVYVNGVEKQSITENTSEMKNALITTSRLNITTDVTTFSVTGMNRVVIGQPGSNTITSITGGVDGQEIIILSTGTNKTTIQHNTSIKLKGGVNYLMGYNHVLTLLNINGTWYEKCRSENA